MKFSKVLLGSAAVLFLSAFYAPSSMAAAPCKGPNKNDPGCPGAEPPPPPEPVLPGGMVDSVTVDWFNQVIVVRGSGVDGVATWGLGAAAGPLPTANVTPDQLEIPFNADLDTEVSGAGSYVLTADGVGELTVYIESAIVDPAATGCPCADIWDDYTIEFWGAQTAACVEIAGPGSNDIADISATAYPDPDFPLDNPQYPIGASFYPGEPENSVCRLVQVNTDATTMELVNERINETQQEECRTLLVANVCTP